MPRDDNAKAQVQRCAIYTRKSHEEGLEQDFNSLDAQREACEAFITSQKHEGWAALPDFYDDGGISGATIERPALQRLLEDVRERRIDVVVVYKVDRLTRSLSDFAKIVDAFDEHGVSFVSVTQQFNTTTSMGRLTLNVLLSFAQFEREVTAERIRDKIAASKKKGMWMGGVPPLGYDAKDRQLVVNDAEAKRVRHIFRRYLELKSVLSLMEVLKAEGVVSKQRVSEAGRTSGGVTFNRGALYHLLQNRIYLGEITHKDRSYTGLHDAIVPADLWDGVQALLAENRVERRTGGRAREPSLLAGLIFDDKGVRMTPSHAKRKGKRYRYYVSSNLIKGRKSEKNVGRRTPAGEVERVVSDRMLELLRDRRTVLSAVEAVTNDPGERESLMNQVAAVADAWNNLEPAHQRKLLLKLIVRIDILPEAVHLQVRSHALAHLTLEEDRSVTDIGGPVETLEIPARLKRTGMETRMVIEGPNKKNERRKPDRSLVRLLLTAQRYQALVTKSRGRSIPDLASEEGVTPSYFTRALRLAYLAPDIITEILNAENPPELSAAQLKSASRLPLKWDEQRVLLGFPLN